MKQTLLAHIHQYPLMQPSDMVKLLYQSEFAGGHMITDPAQCLSRLVDESRSAAPRAAADAFVPIGGGLCRLYLGALTALDITPQTLNRLFIATANTVTGSADRFSAKLDAFLDWCRSGELPCDFAAAERYVRYYRAQGCPPVSHSNAYRAAYAPAYRVVKAAYCRYLEVFRRIEALLNKKFAVTVAIEGNSGAGKSTLAALLAEVYNCNVFHTDDFFLPSERKTAQRLAEPGGNVDYERLQSEVARGILSGGDVTYRRYDCRTGILGEPITAPPTRLSVVEGVYSLHPALGLAYDLTVFLKAEGAAQQQRIRLRSGDTMLKRFINEWIPLENRYFDAYHIEQKCDLKFLLDENMEACI